MRYLASFFMASVFLVTPVQMREPDAIKGLNKAPSPRTIKRNSALGRPEARNQPVSPIRFIRAYVADNRLSALRRQPDQQSAVLQRLQIGHKVYIIGPAGISGTSAEFYRVAVSRRTRGWMLRESIIIPTRASEDVKLLKLIENGEDGIDQLTMCRLFLNCMRRSPLTPRVILLMGEEADRQANLVSKRARSRLLKYSTKENPSALRALYLNDPGLDRYSRLGLRFDFNPESGEYTYDGQAFRELISRYPDSAEAATARKHLNDGGQKTAKNRP